MTDLIPALPLPALRDPAALIRMAYMGEDVLALIRQQEDALPFLPDPAAAWMTLSLLYQLAGARDHALACQEKGLETHCLFRNEITSRPALRLLAFVSPGDLMTNTPIDLLLEGESVDIIRLFVSPGRDLPARIPDHDIALVGISEAEHTADTLHRLATILPHWPRPVLNDPLRILDLARDRLFQRLNGAPGIVMPPTWRESAAGIRAHGASLLPIIIRPITSHAGEGLELLQHPDHIEMYLGQRRETDFYLSPFIHYANADGHFRKYRIAFFDNQAHLCHMAIGDHWMVHYLNANMADDSVKRAEEAHVMAHFHTDFAIRHREAFAALIERLGLDYVVIDCAETPDGQLLVFEASVAMIVHALDSETIFPYKAPHMHDLFAAWHTYLEKRAVAAWRAMRREGSGG